MASGCILQRPSLTGDEAEWIYLTPDWQVESQHGDYRPEWETGRVNEGVFIVRHFKISLPSFFLLWPNEPIDPHPSTQRCKRKENRCPSPCARKTESVIRSLFAPLVLHHHETFTAKETFARMNWWQAYMILGPEPRAGSFHLNKWLFNCKAK